MSGNAAEGEGPRSSEPQSLRTLRFGDRTISYDHEGDDDGVGSKIGLGIEEEGETQGRHTKINLLLHHYILRSCAPSPLHCCFNLSRHILADANKAVD